MKKNSLLCIIIAVAVVEGALGQVASGPATGSVPSGFVRSTMTFAPGERGPGPLFRKPANKHRVFPLPDPPDLPHPTGPPGSNYIEDRSVAAGQSVVSIPVASFQGIAQTNSIPPDPHFAVGPNHVMEVVNTSFRIATKAGTTITTINADSWHSGIVPGVFSFDPKVLYDHYANRWIMVWLDQDDAATRGTYLISVSDDADPNGTWYVWALPSTVNGSTFANNWADYQGVGYDSVAIYFTSNQFGFDGNYNYVKIRIMPKAQFYANTGGSITWTDFWNIKSATGVTMFGIRPSISYTTSGAYHLLGTSPFTTSTFFALYKITDPIGSPAITVVHVPVVATTTAPDAGQPNGATALEGGGSNLRNEPTYRDGFLWAVHSVANGSNSATRYLRISTSTNTATEDVAFGAVGYWHIYNALTVDKDKNVAITFTRSGVNEFPSAAFTWRLDSDPPGLRPTEIMRPGVGTYVRLGSGRNRWGDYLGAWIDPVDQNNFWLFSEYAVATNAWGTWVHAMRVVPYTGAKLALPTKSLSHGLQEAGTAGDTLRAVILNYGSDSLVVSSITNNNAAFHLVGLPSFPHSLGTFDSLEVRVVFAPISHGTMLDTILVASNDLTSPAKIALSGKGVVIGTARPGILYGASGSPTSQLYTLNPQTGAATLVGPTGLADLQGLTVHPLTHELVGIRPVTGGTEIVRISAQYGDALPVQTTPLVNFRAIVFSSIGGFYGATTAGRLYLVSIATGDTFGIGTAPGITYASLSFNPITGKLYASVRPPFSGRDRIYTVDVATGAATLVGANGDNVTTPSITFDGLGVLYGLKGLAPQASNLIRIDTTTGVGTLIGPTGLTTLQAIAMRADSLLVSVDENGGNIFPVTFVLEQNYPNPFNPATTIRYTIPNTSHITLRVFDVLGREVTTLVDEQLKAGAYERQFYGDNFPSGVYFYRLQAGKFSDTRKLLLLK